MAEEQRKLTPDETTAIKSKLSSVLQNTSEDASDLIEYTLAMIVNGKSVDYIVDELKGMEMDICDAEACDTIGNEILSFLNDSEKRKTSTTEKTKIQFNKSSVENALTKSGALGTKKSSNALSVSGALGASRQKDGKKDQRHGDKQRGPDDRNQSDRARDRQGRGSRGGRSIASEAFNRLSGQRQRDDKRGAQGGRGGGRDGGQSGRGGRGERGGRGRDWSQPGGQLNKRGRDENNRHGGGGRGKDPNFSNKKTKRDEGLTNQEQKKQDGQENLEYQEYGEEYNAGYDYSAWNGWDDGSGYYGYPYGYAGYDPNYWNTGYPFHGGRGRGRGRGGRGRGRGGDAQQVDTTGPTNVEGETVNGESNDTTDNEGAPTAQTTTDELTMAAAAVSASPLVGSHFSRYSYSSSGRTPGRGRGGRGRGRGGRALVAERLAAMTWSRSKATENSNATNETQETAAAPEQSS